MPAREQYEAADFIGVTAPAHQEGALSQMGERARRVASEVEDPRAERSFVVGVRDCCEPRLNDGYAGREFEVIVPSPEIARALVAALLERGHIEDVPHGRFVKALAGGSRTVTLEPLP